MSEILLYGEIGWENTSKSVVEQLATMDGDITLRVNSPGGDVYEGIGIMNALRGYQGGVVTAVIEGMAASAASFIVVGGADRIVARPNAEIMIHDAWTFVDGNAEKLAKTLADLERMSENLAGIYAERVGGEPSEWRAKMKAETWFSAQEALDAGLVDAVEDARQPVSAKAGPLVFAKALARFKYAGRAVAPDPKIEAPSGQEGHSMNVLNELARELGKKPEDVQRALSGFFNGQVEVPVAVVLDYPDTAEVIPTGKVEIEPEGDLPDGATVEVEAPENFTAEVGEDGKVTVRASDAVTVGDAADVVVTITGAGEPVTATIKVTVIAASVEEESAPAPEPAPANDGTITLDLDTFNELKARADLGAKAHEFAQAKARVDEVEKWVTEGRIPAAVKPKALALAKSDMDAARKLYGSNPVNTIPRAEVGYGLDENEDDAEKVPSFEELDARWNTRKSGK